MNDLTLAPTALRQFAVSIMTASAHEHICILARTSCDAAIQAVQLMYLDAVDCIATGLKIKVEPVRVMAASSKEAA